MGTVVGVLTTAAAAVVEVVVGALLRGRRARLLLLAPGGERLRWHAGRVRARRAADRARRQVPAYRDHLARHGIGPGFSPPWDELPETDKAGYITRHRIEALCRGGRLPRRGVVLDESSGSSGTPTSWARGAAERRATARMLRTTLARGLDAGPVVVCNAFALGAWATGLHVSAALSSSCRIKSTGPDRTKVIATIRELGPDHRYVVLGYPPFLKDLADDPRIDLAAHDVVAGFGGEGLSENMRDYLLQHYRRVLGSYGASDLEINMAAETPFTVALRRALLADAGLRTALLGRRADGPPPMVFQYNPLDYVLETNAAGELVVTVCRAANLSPRIRYNIHDLGHVLRMPALRRVLRACGRADLAALADTDLPVLFHHGRADASVDFYGAVVGPDDLRDALYAQPSLAGRMRRFRLLHWEGAGAAPRLDLAVELQPGRVADDLDGDALGAAVLTAMGRRNADFANACRIAVAAPRLRVHAAGTGPFRHGDGLKQRYVDRVDHDPAAP